MKRTLVFGDIHGGLKALIQLLEKVDAKEEERLVFLGDYVDGWSESSQVIDFLIQLSQKKIAFSYAEIMMFGVMNG
jgi:serine/threonine protein phosphatase 1